MQYVENRHEAPCPFPPVPSPYSDLSVPNNVPAYQPVWLLIPIVAFASLVLGGLLPTHPRGMQGSARFGPGRQKEFKSGSDAGDFSQMPEYRQSAREALLSALKSATAALWYLGTSALQGPRVYCSIFTRRASFGGTGGIRPRQKPPLCTAGHCTAPPPVAPLPIYRGGPRLEHPPGWHARR